MPFTAIAEDPRLITAVKTADTERASTTTLADDPDLTIAVKANTTYMIEFVMAHNIPAAPDLKYCFTLPAAGALYALDGWLAVNGQDGWDAAPGTGAPVTIAGQAADKYTQYRLLYIGGANAGSVTLQWAQAISDASATKVLKGSFMKAVELG